jgi:hypothetical protein
MKQKREIICCDEAKSRFQENGHVSYMQAGGGGKASDEVAGRHPSRWRRVSALPVRWKRVSSRGAAAATSPAETNTGARRDPAGSAAGAMGRGAQQGRDYGGCATSLFGGDANRWDEEEIRYVLGSTRLSFTRFLQHRQDTRR